MKSVIESATKLRAEDGEPDDATASIAESLKDVLRSLGEDPQREGLLRTPERAAKALRFLTSGYSTDIGKLVNNALFRVKYDEMVIVKNIEFHSLDRILESSKRVLVRYWRDKEPIVELVPKETSYTTAFLKDP